MKDHDRICAVLISFEPEKHIVRNVRMIASQAWKVMVVDNGSSRASKKYLRTIEKIPRVEVIYLKDNYGIGAALNIAAQRAMEAAFPWVATFDQDTVIENGYLQKIMKTVKLYPRLENVGLVAPRIQDIKYDDVYSYSNTVDKMIEVDLAITSGSVFRIEAFQKAGGFDEKLFIDYVDFDFCLRLKKAGYKILELRDSTLVHRIGAMTRHPFMGANIYTSNHSPLRRYYKHRNRIHMLKRYLFSHPKWAARDTLSILFEVPKILLWEKQKMKKIGFITLGIVHGMAGVTGKFKRAHGIS